MLTIICGEDIISSRKYFNDLKIDLIKQGFILKEILPQEAISLTAQSSNTLSLFNEKVAFITVNLDRYVKKFSRSEKGKAIILKLEEIVRAKNLILVSWEDSVSLYNLKLKKIGVVKEFKPTVSIFNLLDYCYPGNLKMFLAQLTTLVETSDEQFIFIMLCRHIRALILASNNLLAGVSPWQKYKLIGQVKKWPISKLLGFYEGLHKIDISLKAGGSYRGVKSALDILSCFYL